MCVCVCGVCGKWMKGSLTAATGQSHFPFKLKCIKSQWTQTSARFYFVHNSDSVKDVNEMLKLSMPNKKQKWINSKIIFLVIYERIKSHETCKASLCWQYIFFFRVCFQNIVTNQMEDILALDAHDFPYAKSFCTAFPIN